METDSPQPARLSPWWRHGAIITLIAGFSILIGLTIRSYRNAPPIPERVTAPLGEVVFTGDDIRKGQKVFMKYGLMENGTLWGHGAYLGPDFSAEYLHTLVLDAQESIAQKFFSRSYRDLSLIEKSAVDSEVKQVLKSNAYSPDSGVLSYTDYETESFKKQVEKWKTYFAEPKTNLGLPAVYISDSEEIRQLTAFFAWAAWASAAKRPGKDYSYTNNFPYDPLAGNTPTKDAILWSALSLIALLGGIALVLVLFGKFDYLGWKEQDKHFHPEAVYGNATPGQKTVIKYFVIVALLFLVQCLVGGATAHYRAEAGHFFGIDISGIFPSVIMRTWHLQLAIFWIATAFIAGGLLLAVSLGKGEPKGYNIGVNLLFIALIIVVVGSLFGEYLGIKQLFGNLWYWFGHQGWEYLDLGRFWQVLLAAGLIFWLTLLFRAISPARKTPERNEIASLFLYSAIGIPLFYIPAFFFSAASNYAVVETWRFWIIHLWVEGFFELFVTVMVAIIFFELGIVRQITAVRVVYLDAILYLAGGIIGTAHHWYWTGQTSASIALGAVFSAMEVVPLTLLTLDAWDFIKLSRGKCDTCGKEVGLPHKWTFYFLMAVGFWNFLGAGVFGFLINMPIISYFEVGTILTPNHGHAAMMGVFGMLALALLVFALRHVSPDEQWKKIEICIKISFWGVNGGLMLMIITNLFPGGVIQLADVIQNGYWHARSAEFIQSGLMHTIEWLRMPGDLIFILFGCIPVLWASVKTYKYISTSK